MTARRDDEPRSAFHEAGHACVCIELRMSFRTVDIIHRGDQFGVVIRRKSRAKFLADFTDPRTIDWVERDILVSFAGGIAQRRFAPRSRWARAMGHDGLEQDCYYGDDEPTTYYVKIGQGSDLQRIENMLVVLGRRGDDAYREQLETRAENLVRELWPEICAVSKVLLRKKVLTQAEVRRIMNRARRHRAKQNEE
jgi:hypothetical protein